MNKIQAGCIFQTVLFSQEEAMPREKALRANRAELAQYIKKLDDLHIRYQITDFAEQKDGSILIKIRRQQDYVIDVKPYFKKM